MLDIPKLLKAAKEMTPLPATTVRLAQLVVDLDADLDQLADVVSLDQALTVRMLRMANSAFSGSETRVTEVREAVMRLGAAQVLAFAMSAHARALLCRPVSAYAFSEHELWKHSVRAALATELLPRVLNRPVPAGAFAAALLHDIGKLVIDRTLSEVELEFLRRAREEGQLSLPQAEAEILQIDHAELGGVVARYWNVPEQIIQGIIYHHQPERIMSEISDIVYLANLAAKCSEETADLKPEMTIDPGVVERTRISGKVVIKLAAAVEERFDEVFQLYESGA